MTMQEMQELFEKHREEYLRFDAVEPKRSVRPDLHAFLLLDELAPGKGDMPFDDDDVVLDACGRVIHSGRDADLAAYRVAFAEWYRKQRSEPTSNVLPPGVGGA